MKRNKKGFTLVELVIVIAVIAILAGVMIAVFSGVVRRAEESAKLQEIKNQEIAQKADDILKKVDNANWLGWEDFETSVVEKLTKVIVDNKTPGEVTLDSQAVQSAVTAAVTQYYAEHKLDNTALTEEQVKVIINDAFKANYNGVTEAQVRTIVNTAVNSIGSPLSKTQIQAIVDAAVAKVEAGKLTAAQVSSAVATAVKGLASNATVDQIKAEVETAVANLATLSEKTLTEAQVKAILETVVKEQGSTAWVTSESYKTEDTFTLTSAEDIKGLATLVNGGYDFDDKTIVLSGTKETTDSTPVIDMTGVAFTPIGNTRGAEFKGVISGGDEGVVIKGLTLKEQFNAIIKGYLIDCSSTGYMDKVGVGFVAYLGEGATLENIDFVDVNVDITTQDLNGLFYDGISVGAAVGYLDGGTIKNVNVLSGHVKSVYRTAGLVGAASHGKIENCNVGTADEAIVIASTGSAAAGTKYYNDKVKEFQPVTSSSKYLNAGGLIGYLRNFAGISNDDCKLEISNCKLNVNLSTASGNAVGTLCAQRNRGTDNTVTINGTSITKINAVNVDGTESTTTALEYNSFSN